MYANELRRYLAVYLAIRSALGHSDHALKIMLKDFVAYIIENDDSFPIKAMLAVNWASRASSSRGRSGQSSRLSAARGFLTYLHAHVPDVEIPDKGLLRGSRRTTPYIFSKSQVISLLQAAENTRPRGGLRRHTYSSIIGLMASTGLRVGEVIALSVFDVILGGHSPRLIITESKFYKSRVVPLHPSTAKQLRKYKKLRHTLGYAGLSDSFFVSEQGKPLSHAVLWRWFKLTTKRLAMYPRGDAREPTLQSLRHYFAVERLTEWCKQKKPVHDLIPNLSVYLGHISPEESYWYLTATPALLNTASDSFERYINHDEGELL